MKAGKNIPNSVLVNLSLFAGLLLTGCVSDGLTGETACVTGVIVGQKCNDYALKLDRKGLLGAKDWQKKTFKEDGPSMLTDYKNVIGLLDLPEPYRRDGLRIFVKLRNPTEQESLVPCYLDMPNPPEPVYIVLAADTLTCPAETQLK